MTPEAANASDICTACGMCCDGSLFRSVFAKPEEIESLPKAGFHLIPMGKDLGFTQPCAQLCGTRCGAYDVRPKVCRNYTCSTLDALLEDRIDFGEAMNRVAQARSAIESLKVELLPGETIYDAKHRLHKALSGEGNAEASPRFKLLLGIAELLLDRHFRHEGQQAFGAMG